MNNLKFITEVNGLSDVLNVLIPNEMSIKMFENK